MIRLIGQGSYGKVYEAIHRLTKKKVALKCIEKIKCRSPDAVPKIFNEVEILSLCNHNNIVKILEVFENNKFYFLATEFVEKGDLFKMFQKNQYFEED